MTWSVESWKGFWQNPRPDVARQRVPTIVAPDVEAVWPRSSRLVRGPEAYAERVIELLRLVPDLHLELLEQANNGDTYFLRWRARATGHEGIGCDRIVLRAGLVISNLVMSDMPMFEALEKRLEGR